MFSDHYNNWTNSRINGINKYIGSEYFAGKRLLELGCGYGYIGNKFHEMGAIVTSSDARKEHIAHVNKIFPHLHTLLIDGNTDSILDKYDICVHWGLLYHLNEIETHLEKIATICDVLLLETEVCDSDDDSFFITTTEHGYDQAFNSNGIRPSSTYVEKILTKHGFEYEMIKDPILNAHFHKYDWEISNSKSWVHGLRRFWICWKKVKSPLLKIIVPN